MKKICNISGVFALLLSLALSSGCTCGFDCSSDDDDAIGPVSLTLLFSDALPDELSEVVLSVDKIELVRDDGNVTEVDTFSISRLELTDAETFEIDLLTVDGDAPLTVFSGLTLEPDFYDEINIRVNETEPELSYVLDAQGMRKPLTVTGNVLSLPGRQFDGGTQEFAIEFGLAQALRFLGDDEGYRLTEDGLRLQNTATAVNLRGSISSELLDTTAECEEKSDPLEFNRVYIYEGTVERTSLADLFTQDSDTEVPADAVAPFAVASIEQAAPADAPLNYFFSFLPEGEYTLAFACNAEDDDAIDYDGIVIAEPEEQVYFLDLPTSGETFECDLTIERDCEP